ncbi:MAG: MurR/RpiR family transcriptional regulator [Clostridiales bacterium]|nr:MurR/RpiR family transcriptional regulator [Clostridia bacterium]MCR5353442.1 MurR/RpiR family transcriptional regulator [Clostridiales bacterium]
MQTAGLFEQIRKALPGMSKSHKKIANYIIDHSEKTAYLTATKLGECVGTSESTVVRFAIELGFSGYPEFQTELRKSLRSKLTAVQRIDVADTMMGEKNILQKVMSSDIGNLKASLANLDEKAFEEAVDAICSAKNIYIIGKRSSYMLADFMNHYFSYIFDNVHLVSSNSTSELFEEIFRISKDDVLIAISYPRYSKRTKTAAEFSKKKGATVIALTDGDMAPITEFADVKLFAISDMASFVDSLVAPLSIINALIVAIGRKNRITIENTFNELEKIWDEYDVYEAARS